MAEKEQILAIERIEEYYYHLADTQFTLRACNYLSNISKYLFLLTKNPYYEKFS